MKEIFSTVAFELQAGERVGIRVRRGQELTVSGARLWLTRSNDDVDYFLFNGDALSLRPRETLWISVDDDQAARLVFTLAGGTGSRIADWFNDWSQRVLPSGLSGSKLGLRIG